MSNGRSKARRLPAKYCSSWRAASARMLPGAGSYLGAPSPDGARSMFVSPRSDASITSGPREVETSARSRCADLCGVATAIDWTVAPRAALAPSSRLQRDEQVRGQVDLDERRDENEGNGYGDGPQEQAPRFCGRSENAARGGRKRKEKGAQLGRLSLIHISEPTRLGMISYAVFCLKKKI